MISISKISDLWCWNHYKPDTLNGFQQNHFA